MVSFVPSDGRISAYFASINLKLSQHSYFEACFHSMLSKYENSKNIFLGRHQ